MPAPERSSGSRTSDIMRALVVEDDPDVGPDVVRGLQAAGFVVDLVRNGEDAWFRGDTEDYDIAVVDLGLPRLDGLSVIRRWRRSHWPNASWSLARTSGQRDRSWLSASA